MRVSTIFVVGHPDICMVLFFVCFVFWNHLCFFSPAWALRTMQTWLHHTHLPPHHLITHVSHPLPPPCSPLSHPHSSPSSMGGNSLCTSRELLRRWRAKGCIFTLLLPLKRPPWSPLCPSNRHFRRWSPPIIIIVVVAFLFIKIFV